MPNEVCLQTRLATEADMQDLLDWRNDPQTRRMSFDGEPVASSDHEAWFRRSLSSRYRVIVIGIHRGQKVGMVRFDREARIAVVGISLNPAFRGRGLAARLLTESEPLIPASWRIEALKAAIKVANLPSLKAFERAGYRSGGDKAEVAGVLAYIYWKGLSTWEHSSCARGVRH